MIKRSGIIFDGEINCGSLWIDDGLENHQETKILINPWSENCDDLKPIKLAPVHEEKLFPFKIKFPARSFLTIIFSGLTGLSLFGFLFLFWPIIYQEVRYNFFRSSQTVALDKSFPGFPNGNQRSPVNTNFSIMIPKIEAKSAVIINVDSSNEEIYTQALKKGIAHAKGSCLPGMNCRIYLFAHSASSPIDIINYNAVFFLLNKLESGDQILIYFSGKKFLYEVTGKEIVGKEETHYLTDLGNKEELILQTCDPPGTTLNRLFVFAKPKLVEYLK